MLWKLFQITMYRAVSFFSMGAWYTTVWRCCNEVLTWWVHSDYKIPKSSLLRTVSFPSHRLGAQKEFSVGTYELQVMGGFKVRYIDWSAVHTVTRTVIEEIYWAICWRKELRLRYWEKLTVGRGRKKKRKRETSRQRTRQRVREEPCWPGAGEVRE